MYEEYNDRKGEGWRRRWERGSKGIKLTENSVSEIGMNNLLSKTIHGCLSFSVDSEL